jgi:hypothetical protein
MSECACCGMDDSENLITFSRFPRKGGGYVLLCDECSYHYEPGKSCIMVECDEV